MDSEPNLELSPLEQMIFEQFAQLPRAAQEALLIELSEMLEQEEDDPDPLMLVGADPYEQQREALDDDVYAWLEAERSEILYSRENPDY
jgi:hypothetical protein